MAFRWQDDDGLTLILAWFFREMSLNPPPPPPPPHLDPPVTLCRTLLPNFLQLPCSTSDKHVLRDKENNSVDPDQLVSQKPTVFSN